MSTNCLAWSITTTAPSPQSRCGRHEESANIHSVEHSFLGRNTARVLSDRDCWIRCIDFADSAFLKLSLSDVVTYRFLERPTWAAMTVAIRDAVRKRVSRRLLVLYLFGNAECPLE